jgi:hypothetical protein
MARKLAVWISTTIPLASSIPSAVRFTMSPRSMGTASSIPTMYRISVRA